MNSETVSILIVDDEPPLLRLMAAYLERLGYSVTSCPDATKGLESFVPGAFRVVITDLSLPDLKGDEMALRMLERDASIRVLLCSGYPFDVASLPPEHRASFGVLQKPFLPNMLAKSVEDLIKQAS